MTTQPAGTGSGVPQEWPAPPPRANLPRSRPAVPQAGDTGEGGTETFTRRPGAVRALAGHHSTAITPWLWMAADVAAGFTAHDFPGFKAKAVMAGACAACAGFRALRVVVHGKRSGRVRRVMLLTWGLGTAWLGAASFLGPLAGPRHALLLALLAGGPALVRAWRHVAGRRPAAVRERAPEEPKALPAADAPAFAEFKGKFCGHGSPLHKARMSFAEIDGGFCVTFRVDPDSACTRGHVEALAIPVAKHYDLPADNVIIEEIPGNRSIARGQITVLTEDNAMLEPRRWDGKSTYDPATGQFEFGYFADGSPEHFSLHQPRSGAMPAVIAGYQGSGKTGDLLVITTEAGLAQVCRDCLGRGGCMRCRPARICCVWVADPQKQPFVELKGRAELTAWGLQASALMAVWSLVVVRHRDIGETAWKDHLGRVHDGKGYFDPTPQVPLLQATFDEWPQVVTLPRYGEWAVQASGRVLELGRKGGVGPNKVVLLPDLPYFGDRVVAQLIKAANVICHRTDGMSKGMLGVKGEPQGLPAGVPGLHYANGPDYRPATKARTKYLPESLQPGEDGVDARQLWDEISMEPVRLEDSLMKVLGPLGYTGGGQVLRDEDITEAMWVAALVAAGLIEQPPPKAAAPAKQAAAPAAAQPGEAAPAMGAPVSVRVAATARRVIEQVGRDEGRPASFRDLMAIGGLSGLEALNAAKELVAVGDAVRTPDGNFTAPGGDTA